MNWQSLEWHHAFKVAGWCGASGQRSLQGRSVDLGRGGGSRIRNGHVYVVVSERDDNGVYQGLFPRNWVTLERFGSHR